jgi:protoporphyrinogen/coproporphyrinogen III oxidase
MATSRRTDADVLVIGAGLAGLAAAHQLSQNGLRVLVLEREQEAGGRARSERWEGCTIELGASFGTPAYRRLLRLIETCGLDDRLAPMPNALRTAIRRNGRWHHLDLRQPEIELVRYRGIDWREKSRLVRLLPSQLRVAPFMRYFDLASVAGIDSGRLEDVIGPTINRYFASALAEVFCGYPPEEVSLAFGVLGSRYPIRRPWLLEGGIGSLTGELARRLQPRCDIAAERVTVDGEGVVAETNPGETLRARAAILATRAHEALELWRDAPEETRRFLGGQAYSQGFGVFLRTSEPVRRSDPDGRDLYMEIVPHGEGPEALLAVIYLNEAAADGGLVGLAAAPFASAANQDDSELAARLESEFVQLHPELRPRVTARRVMRWPVFLPSYPPGRARELAAFRARLAPAPVQLAGDYLYGPMMEAAVRSGQDAATRASEYLLSVSPGIPSGPVTVARRNP